MKLIEKLFKPNTLIPIYTDKSNRAYMIDVTTKQIYIHTVDLRNHKRAIVIGLMVGVFLLIIGVSYPRLYLTNLSFELKILLLVGGFLIGISVFLGIKNKKYEPSLEKYLKEYPEAKKIKITKRVVENARSHALVAIVGNIVLLVANIFLYSQFFTNHNLGSYVWAIASTTGFLISCLTFRNCVVIFGIRQDKY